MTTTFVVAQDNGKSSFGIIGGVNFQNLTGETSGGNDLNNDLLTGFHVGANVQIPLAPEFYFQPGLLFSVKGAKNKTDLIEKTTKLNYLEMPLNLVYKGALGSGFVLLGVGPYVAYGIGGKVETTGGAVSLDQDIEFKNELDAGDSPTTPYYKAFDAGGNIFAGYEMANGIFLQLNAQLGLLKINPDDNRIIGSNKSSEKNTGFGISAGYRF